MNQTKAFVEFYLKKAGYKKVQWDESHHWQSAKTKTAKGVVDDSAFFVKVRNNKPYIIECQVKTYRILHDALSKNSRVFVPRVICYDVAEGILVTDVAKGNLLTQCLLEKLSSGEGIKAAAELCGLAGTVLANIHDNMPTDESGNILLYRDFGPQNLFYCEDQEIVTLIDPPERIEYGRREKDIGVATIECMKTFLRSWRGLKPSLWNKCRERFISDYENASSSVFIDHELVRRFEIERLRTRILINKQYLLMRFGLKETAKAFGRVVGIGILRFCLK